MKSSHFFLKNYYLRNKREMQEFGLTDLCTKTQFCGNLEGENAELENKRAKTSNSPIILFALNVMHLK